MVPLDLRLVRRGLLKRLCSDDDDDDEGGETLAEKPVDGEAGFAVERDADGTAEGVEVSPAELSSSEGSVTGTAGSISGSLVDIYTAVEMDTGVLVDSYVNSDKMSSS